MIELNQMDKSNKPQTPIYYRIIRGFLILLSSILMFYYLTGIVRYITSGPSTTLFDDITLDYAATIILLGLSLFCLIVAWFRNVSYGIVTLVFLALYVLYISLISSPIEFELALGFLPIAIAVNAIGFIIIGILIKSRKRRQFDINAEAIADKYEGPDVFNFRI